MTANAIYLDYCATTPVDPRVVERMVPFFSQVFGNPSSRTHSYGWQAEAAVYDARLQIMTLIDARSPDEIVFTSGATEANNLAIRGAAEAAAGKTHIITSAIEHPSVLEVCRELSRRGFELTIVGVGANGIVEPDDVRAAIRPDTALISIMAVNHEVGTIQPIAAIGALARAHGIPFHCDATQAACHLDLSVQAAHIDLLSLSSHKLYGPKGVGALYIRRRPFEVAVARQQIGGGQERGLRAGTLNVPGIVGFGEAARILQREREADSARIRILRDRLLTVLRAELPGLHVHGSIETRVAGNLNVSLEGIASDTLLAGVPELALSAGAACSSGKAGGSAVLAAMGYSPEQARCAIRVSLGRMSQPSDVDAAAQTLIAAAHRLRNRRPQTTNSRKETTMEKSFSERVADAKAAVAAITPNEANAVRGQAGVAFVDPRPADAIANTTGLIPGALTVGLADITSGQLPEQLRDKNTRVITACQGGPMGAIAAHELSKLGFAQVQYIEGGTQGWLDAGFQTQR